MSNWILQTALTPSLVNVPVIDLRGHIPVNPKGSWNDINAPRDINKLTTIVFHHTGISKSSTAKYMDEEFIRNIANSHIRSTKNRAAGDGGFPYHAMIRNGKVFITNDLPTFVYGVASNNKSTVHISVDGHYAGNDVLNDQDRLALYTAYYLAKGSMPAFEKLVGHSALSPSACPGYDMNKVHKDIAEIDLSMELNENLQSQLLNAAALETRVKDLYGKAIAPGKYQEEAIKKLSKVADMMRVQGLL